MGGGNLTSSQFRTGFLASFMIVTDLALLVGNFLAVVSFCVNNKLHTVTNSFIVSMSVGDLLIAIISIPTLLVSNVIGPSLTSTIGLLYCQVSLSITVSLMFVAIANLTLNSLDRYRAILSPLSYNTRMTKRRVFWKIALAWVASFVFGFLPFMGWGRVMDGRDASYTLFCQVRANMSREYTTLFCCIGWLCFVLMGLAYWRIFQTARRHTRTIAADVARLQDSSLVAHIKERRAAKLVGCIMGAFMVCYFPLFVAVVVDLTRGLSPYAYVGCVLLGFINSALNPFIVAAMNREYRMTYKRIIRCNWRKNRVQGDIT